MPKGSRGTQCDTLFIINKKSFPNLFDSGYPSLKNVPIVYLHEMCAKDTYFWRNVQLLFYLPFWWM